MVRDDKERGKNRERDKEIRERKSLPAYSLPCKSHIFVVAAKFKPPLLKVEFKLVGLGNRSTTNCAPTNRSFSSV